MGRSLPPHALCALLIASPVVAQNGGGAPTPEQAERFEDAKLFYANGKLAYDVGRFAEAARQFERAYALRPAPLLLFNMAQCYRQLGDTKKAVFLYESFLRGASEEESAQTKVAREELAKLQVRLEEEMEAERPGPRADAGAGGDEAVAQSAAGPPGSAATSNDEGSDLLLWGAVGGGAVLVVAVATAAIVGVVAATPAPGDVGRVDFR